MLAAHSNQIGKGILWAAMALGLVHAAWSFYWAFGGSWLLDTVGQWAVVSQLHQPVQTFFVLLRHRAGQNRSSSHSRTG